MKTQVPEGDGELRTPQEEFVHALTHGIGALCAILGTVMLVRHAAGSTRAVISVTIFGASLIVLFFSSTMYHSFHQARTRRFFHALDHISIYLLIAGTYTPVCLIALRGVIGWTFFVVLWSLAAVGTVFKIFFTGRYRALSLLFYLMMGWMVAIRVDRTIEVLGPDGFAWLLAGGLAYTAGVPFFAWRSRRWTHAVWHLFVLLGAACHFWTVLRYVVW